MRTTKKELNGIVERMKKYKAIPESTKLKADACGYRLVCSYQFDAGISEIDLSDTYSAKEMAAFLRGVERGNSLPVMLARLV